MPFDLYKTSRRIAPIFQNPKVGCRYVIRALDPVEELFFARGSVRTADAAIAWVIIVGRLLQHLLNVVLHVIQVARHFTL